MATQDKAMESPATKVTAEQLTAMSREDLKALIMGLGGEQLKAISDTMDESLSERRNKKTVEGRQALQDKIRSTITYPVLDKATIDALAEAGAVGYTVIYDLTSGAGTPSPTYSAGKGTKARGTGHAVSAPVGPKRDLKGDWERLASENEKKEDMATAQKMAEASRARGTTADQTANIWSGKNGLYHKRLAAIEARGKQVATS